MKLSLTVSPDAPAKAPVVWKGDLAKGIAKAAELGYDAIELHVYRLEPNEVAELQQLLQEEGVAVSGVCHGMAYRGDSSSFSNEDPGLRRKAVDRMKHHIDLAHAFGTQVISGIVHGEMSPEPSQRERQREWVLECFREIDNYACPLGVAFSIEAVNRYETNCFNTSQEIAAFISSNRFTSCRVHLDTFHMNIEESSIEQAIKLAGPLLSYVHFADSNRRYPGSGHLNYASIIDALRQAGYDGYLGMEMLSIPDPLTAAREALQMTRRLLA